MCITLRTIGFGFFLGLVFLVFFVAYEANAMVIDNSGEIIRDSDILETTIRFNQAEIKYIGNWKDTFGLDEIKENYTRVGNIYTFYSGQAFTKQDDLWFEVEFATTTLSEFDKATKEPVSGLFKYFTINGVSAQSFYSSAGDGHVRKADSANWATTRGAAAGSAVSHTDTSGNFIQARYTGAVFVIARGFLPFDTSGIGTDNVVASSALVLKVAGEANPDNDGYDYVAIITDTSQASDLSLVVGDYEDCGDLNNPATSSQLSLSDSAGAGNYDWFSINSTTTIIRDGYTELGARMGHDIDNHQISGTNNNFYQIYFSEYAGTDSDPILIVELASTSSPPAGETSTSSTSLPCNLENITNNELTMFVGCTETYESVSATPTATSYSYYHIPFFAWVVILIPTLWIGNRFIIEIIKRFNN